MVMEENNRLKYVLKSMDEFIEKLKTPEGKKILDKWVKNDLEIITQRQLKIENIIKDDDYMLWLEMFTANNPIFDNGEWLNYNENISFDESEKVRDIGLLFEILYMYAEPNDYQELFCYKIKFNDTGYKISILNGQGSCCVCKRIEIDNEEEFIDFKELRNNFNSDEKITINKILIKK